MDVAGLKIRRTSVLGGSTPPPGTITFVINNLRFILPPPYHLEP